MLTRKVLNEIEDVTDEFYPALAMLRRYKDKEDTPLGFLVALTTRVKIYKNIQELIRRYKRGQDYSAILSRVLKQLRLHRFQINKLSKTHSNDHRSVNRYCIGLAGLLYILFAEKVLD